MGLLSDIFSGSGGGIISSAIGALSQAHTNKLNRDIHDSDNAFNSAQAQIDRDFQASQAQNQMDFQERMYQQYQSPEALVAQYESAGLNPALMMSEGAKFPGSFSGASGSGAQASSASPISMQSPLDALTLAQARNYNADAKKKESETEGIDIENSKKDQLLASQIQSNKASADEKIAAASLYGIESQRERELLPILVKLNNLDVQLKDKNLGLTDAQISKTKQERDNLAKEYTNIVKQGLVLDSQSGLISAERIQALASAKLLSEQAITELRKQDLLDSEFNVNTSKFKLNIATIRHLASQDLLLDEQALTESVLRDAKAFQTIASGIQSYSNAHTANNLFGISTLDSGMISGVVQDYSDKFNWHSRIHW